MSRDHVRRHGRHRDLAPALGLAAVLVALFVSSLVGIVLFLRSLLQLFLEIAGQAMNAGP